MAEETLFEHAGGVDALHRVVAHWYPRVLADPLLHPLFGAGQPTHVDHLTAFFAEVLGGPPRYSDDLGGFAALLAAHRGLRIEEAQRRRFVELFLDSADAVGLPADTSFRDALTRYLEFGTEVALVNSHATTEDELHSCQVVPQWGWTSR
jgi:hemoglobin